MIIAHRGASAEAPEHTIAAFELALAQGADAIELDVHLSRDHHPVVIHDFDLDRTTDGRGPVGARTVRELKRLDAGGWLGPGFRGQRVQTLAEVLERFRDRTRFWVEVKAGSARYPGIEERVLGALEVYDVLDRSLVQSFDPAVLATLRSLSTEVALGALLAGPPVDPGSLPPGLVQALCPQAGLVTEAAVERLREAGLGCYVWTVNDPEAMDRLAGWGVSGIITDRPGLLAARLGRA